MLPPSVTTQESAPLDEEFTVNLAIGIVGVMLSDAVRVVPPEAALIVALVEAAAGAVRIWNVALVAPDATVTLPGTVAAALLLDRVTLALPVAADDSVTVPWDDIPASTDAGFSASAEGAGAGPGVGVGEGVGVGDGVGAGAGDGLGATEDDPELPPPQSIKSARASNTAASTGTFAKSLFVVIASPSFNELRTTQRTHGSASSGRSSRSTRSES